MKEFVRRDSLWVLAQNFLTLLVLALGPLFSGQWHGPAGVVAGGALVLAGAVFGIAGVRALGANLTPYPEPRPNAQLVQHGIYRVVRHPLYSSLIFLSFGWVLLWRSWPALVAAPALTLLLDAKARVEERRLRERFTEYAAYAKRVRRFVPGVY